MALYWEGNRQMHWRDVRDVEDAQNAENAGTAA
jgi:hypothetical protein